MYIKCKHRNYSLFGIKCSHFIIQSYSKLKTKLKFSFAPPSVLLPIFNNFWLAVIFQFLLCTARWKYSFFELRRHDWSSENKFVKLAAVCQEIFQNDNKTEGATTKDFQFWICHLNDIKQHNILWDFLENIHIFQRKLDWLVSPRSIKEWWH